MLKGVWGTLLAVDRLETVVVTDDVVVCTSSRTCGRTAVTVPTVRVLVRITPTMPRLLTFAPTDRRGFSREIRA
jgi:hypothetical protein